MIDWTFQFQWGEKLHYRCRILEKKEMGVSSFENGQKCGSKSDAMWNITTFKYQSQNSKLHSLHCQLFWKCQLGLSNAKAKLLNDNFRWQTLSNSAKFELFGSKNSRPFGADAINKYFSGLSWKTRWWPNIGGALCSTPQSLADAY